MRLLLGASLLAFAAAGLVACGGGGSTAAPALATATPIALPTAANGVAATPLPVPTAGSTVTQVVGSSINPITGAVVTPAPVTAPDGSQVIPVPLPSDSSKIGGTFSIPATTQIAAGTTLNETMTSVVPTGLPALSHARTVLDATTRQPLLYLAMRFSSDVTLPKGPTIAITFPLPLPSNYAYFVALYDPLRPSLSWQYGYEGAGALSVTNGISQLSFTANAQPISLAAFTTYYFAVYAQSQAAPSPTPAPIGVATIAPSPSPAPLVATPAALNLSGTGAANAATIAISEAGYSGPFTTSAPDCGSGSTAIATVAAGSTAGSFTITPVSVGACRVVVAGDRGRSVIVPVTVSQSGASVTIPAASASPSPSPSAAPFVVPTSLAVDVAGSTTLTVAAGTVTSGSVFVTAGDVTVARVLPQVWSSPLPATFTVNGLRAGTTTLTISDGAATTPGVHTVQVPVTVGAVTGSITIPGFPSSPVPSPPAVSPASIASLTAGTSQTFSVTSGQANYSGPIFAVSSSPFFLSVSPNVWTSPAPAVFTVTGLIGPSSSGVTFYDNAGGSRFVPVPIVAPSPATLTAAPSSLTYTSANQFLQVAINEPFRSGQIVGAVCSGSFVFSSPLTTFPSGAATPPPSSVYGQAFGPTAQFFIQAIATGKKTCTATFYDQVNGVTVSVPLIGPP